MEGPYRGGSKLGYGKDCSKVRQGGIDVDNGEAADYYVSFSRVRAALDLAQKKWQQNLA